MPEIDLKKVPFKGIGLVVGVFALVVLSYMGVKSVYEYTAKKNEVARQDQIQTYEQRLAGIKTEVAVKGTDAASFVTLSQQYLTSKDVDRAEVAASLAVEKDPAWRDGFLNQGHVLLVANKFDEAKTAFEKALTIDPLCGQAHYLLSLAYSELKNTDLAKQEFAKAKTFGFETEIGG